MRGFKSLPFQPLRAALLVALCMECVDLNNVHSSPFILLTSRTLYGVRGFKFTFLLNIVTNNRRTLYGVRGFKLIPIRQSSHRLAVALCMECVDLNNDPAIKSCCTGGRTLYGVRGFKFLPSATLTPSLKVALCMECVDLNC